MDATCRFPIPVSMLLGYSLSNHAGFHYNQIKCSMFILIKQNLSMSWCNFARASEATYCTNGKKLIDQLFNSQQ